MLDVVVFFRYEFSGCAARVLKPFGVRPDRDGVWLNEDAILASFGPLNTRVPLAEIAGCDVTGPYSPWKAIGPRVSLADHGISFGTNASRGVCIHFRRPIPRILGPWDHPALTVTVERPAEFAASLTASMERGGRGPAD